LLLLVQSANSRRSVLFCATKRRSGGLLKKMQPGAIDLAISVRRWHMDHLMFRVGFATAKKSRLCKYPTL
jgi:hypothetical protein